MSQTEKAPEDMTDDELLTNYRRAKVTGPVERIDALQHEIAQRWEREQEGLR